MKPSKHAHHFPSHLLATLTGCVLMLACTTGEAHAATTATRTEHHISLTSLKLDGALQTTFRKIRHLVSFFMDSDQPAQSTQENAAHVSAQVLSASAYGFIFRDHVKHVRIRQIRSWLLRE